MATFTENIKGLADGLTGENAEEIKTAVDQFGEFSEKAMGFIAAVNQAGSPTTTPATGGEFVPISCPFTEDQARLIAQQIVAQMKEDGAEVTAEKTAEAVSHEDLGVEVRDTKRSVMGLLNEIKNLLTKLIEVIGKRAMTFDQIYKKFGERLLREHRWK